MAKITYTLLDREYDSIPENENYSSGDLNLIENYQVNKAFNPDTNYIESHFYTLNNQKVFSVYDQDLSTNVEIDAEGRITNLDLQPEKLSIDNGFTGVDHKIVYHFLNDLYTNTNTKQQLFINTISQDRKELLLYTDSLDVNTLINKTETLKSALKSKAYFEEFWLNLGENDLYIVTNIDVYELDDKFTIAIKLYEPLPKQYNLKQEVQLVEKVSDSIVVEVQVEVQDEIETGPRLKGANFNIELEDNNPVPTEYFNYDELFSFSTANSNREIYSYIKESSVAINIDYSDYENFIHFSSAQERLKNFKYKLQLLENYDASKTQITNSANSSGSLVKFDNLIKGIVNNFDHYEKELYFTSSSYSWPKSTTSKPFVNLHSTSSISSDWYTSQLNSASNYDTSNYDVLSATLPSYIAEDTNNSNAILFVDMIGQHFDNLWIYTRAITDKYDNDNRADVGISKDLVREVLASFGTKLYNSTEGSDDLFKYLIADSYDSGSSEEVVNTFTTVPGISTDLQPASRKEYEGDLYKRIYHNLPFLLKTKGTQRGLRALINCFGIPADFLSIKQYGGSDIESSKFFGYEQDKKDSADKVRVETRASGSVGNVLSKFKSIQKTETERTSDTHRIEVGFSPSDSVNAYIIAQVDSTFSIDDYIGEPQDLYNSSYGSLDKFASNLLSTNVERFQLNDFVRILKFYDNVIFKMIKDFIPAKGTLDTGIIIKPNLLDRSKIKSPKLSGTRPEYNGSIDTAFVTGSDGGVYDTVRNKAATQKNIEAHWPSHVGGRSNIVYKPDFISPTNPNPGEIQITGTEFYHPDGNLYTFEDKYSNVFTPYEGAVSTDVDFYLMFTSESQTVRFNALNLSSQHPHIVPVDYSPHGQNSWVARGNNGNVSASFTPLANDVLIAGFTLEAETDLLTRFSNYTKPLSSIITGQKTTIHKQDIPTLSGSVRRWVEDESPKLNGELSGSIIEITNGELNSQNKFKHVKVPALNYDILKINEGSGATYTSFLMDPSPQATATASCAISSPTLSTLYHNDTGSFPATIGTFIFTDIAGANTFTGTTGDKWYRMQNGKTINVSGSTGGNDGYVGQITNCQDFDTTAPSGYTATWNTDNINVSNYTAVPFTMYGVTSGDTYQATASLAADPTEVAYTTGTIYHSYNGGTIDTTDIADGPNVLLNIKLVDQAGNVGLPATVYSGANSSLTASFKNVVSPSGYSVKFYTSSTYGTEATSYSEKNMYVRVEGISNGTQGTIGLTLTSSGGGSYSTTKAIDNSLNNTPTKEFYLNLFHLSTINNGTVTATATITDQAGNVGGAVTDTATLTVVSGDLTIASGTSTITRYAQTKYLKVQSLVPSNSYWTLTDNQSFSFTTQSSGTGNDTSVPVYFQQNYSSSSRTSTFYLKINGITVDYYTIYQQGTSNSGSGGGGCVAPFALILMGDGSQKQAMHVGVGDEIKTQQEKTLEWTNARVNEKKVLTSSRIKILFGDEEIVVSPNHRFYVDNRSEYIPARELVDGDILSGKAYKGVEDYHEGDVIKFSVEYAKTYISNGILSHNIKGIE